MKKTLLIVTLLGTIGNTLANQDARMAEKEFQNRMIQNALKTQGLDNDPEIQHLKTSFERNKTNNPLNNCHFVIGYLNIFAEVGAEKEEQLESLEMQKAISDALFMFENSDMQECLENHFIKEKSKLID